MAVNELDSFRFQRVPLGTQFVGIGPPETRSRLAGGIQDTERVDALGAGHHVAAQRLGSSAYDFREVPVRGPVPCGQRCEDRVQPVPVESAADRRSQSRPPSARSKFKFCT